MGKGVEGEMMATWNKTGTILGRLTSADLKAILEDVRGREIRRRLLNWFEMAVEFDNDLLVSLPYEGKSKPTVEE